MSIDEFFDLGNVTSRLDKAVCLAFPAELVSAPWGDLTPELGIEMWRKASANIDTALTSLLTEFRQGVVESEAELSRRGFGPNKADDDRPEPCAYCGERHG